MKTFDVIYHFGPNDELRATVEAEDADEARRLSWRYAHYQPGREETGSGGDEKSRGLIIQGRSFYINTSRLCYIEVSDAAEKASQPGLGFRKRA